MFIIIIILFLLIQFGQALLIIPSSGTSRNINTWDYFTYAALDLVTKPIYIYKPTYSQQQPCQFQPISNNLSPSDLAYFIAWDEAKLRGCESYFQVYPVVARKILTNK